MNYDCNSYTFEGNTVCISQGNQKLGAIPSVSLPWGITCPEDAPCKGKCNMRAIANYPSVKNTYMNNLTCFKENSEWYFFIIGQVMNANRFFRWHVSGDIPNMEYLKEMCRVCSNIRTARVCVLLRSIILSTIFFLKEIYCRKI